MSTAPRGVDGIPEWLQDVQASLLHSLDALGLAPHVDGQPAWPWAHRLAVETLAIDAALTRQLAWSAAALVLALVLLGLAWRWRRGRGPLVMAAAALALAAPWPSPSLLLQPAVPTSFHQSPAALSVARLTEGLQLYGTHCAECHGADGRGETPRAAQLPVWPPRLSGALLWRRAEGETYWHVRHGLRGRDGGETMPAFGNRLSPEQTWSVLAALRLLASGQSLKEQGRWTYPVAAPDLTMYCPDAPARQLADWRGRRVRIVVAAPLAGMPREDPRFETVVLTDGAAPATSTGCVVAAQAAEARRLVALVAGQATSIDGVQLIVDRDGWLRALGRPGEGGWRAEDLVCRSNGSLPASPSEDGLDALIRRMDADPVRAGRLLRHGGAPS